MSAANSQAWRARRKVLTEAILTMYNSGATAAEMDRAFLCFHPQVVFQDPLVRVQGQDQYQAQFRTLRALFKEFKPLTVEMTGDYDKISIDTTVRWITRFNTLDIRQVTICHVSDGGLGVITKHEDLWSWADTWMQVPLISFFYSRWRPWFGRRSSEQMLKSAEKKNERWVPEARRAASSQYQLPSHNVSTATTAGDADDGEGVPKVYQGNDGIPSERTSLRGSSSQSR